MISDDAPFLLTPIDCLPRTRWVQKILLFPTTTSEPTETFQAIESGLDRTLQAVPYLAGSIVYRSDGAQKGRLAVTAPWRSARDTLTAQDLTIDERFDYDSLRARHFPVDSLSHDLLQPLPRPTERPVMLAQLNFVKGGIIFVISIDHCVVDGTGARAIAEIWAAYCRGDDGSSMVTAEILDRAPLMEGSPHARIESLSDYFTYIPDFFALPGLQDTISPLKRVYYKLRRSMALTFNMVLGGLSNLITYRRLRIPKTTTPDPESSKVISHIFFFSASKLRDLKQTASEMQADKTGAQWISTNDALSALLWCCISTAWKSADYPSHESVWDPWKRMAWQSRGRTTEPLSMLAIIMNARRLTKPPLSPNYIGNAITWGGIPDTFSSFSSTIQCVSKQAYRVREMIAGYDSALLMDVVGALGSVPDIRRVVLGSGAFPTTTVALVSWADQGWYKLDWGSALGGHCERLRVRKEQRTGLCVVLPRLESNERRGGEDAGLEVYVVLKAGDMRRLRQDDLFNRYAEWRCD